MKIPFNEIKEFIDNLKTPVSLIDSNTIPFVKVHIFDGKLYPPYTDWFSIPNPKEPIKTIEIRFSHEKQDWLIDVNTL